MTPEIRVEYIPKHAHKILVIRRDNIAICVHPRR